MKKLILNLIILIVAIFSFLLKPDLVFAQNSNSVIPYIIVPSDWRSRISPATEERYKQNMLNVLGEAKQFYSKKLGGHTFEYVNNVNVINAKRPIGIINPGEHLPSTLYQLGLDPYILNASYGHVHVFVVVGSSNRGAGALSGDSNVREGSTRGQVYINHEEVEEWGSTDFRIRTRAIGGLIHELGHTFGLTYSGWANAHPCSEISKHECIDLPGLGVSIPYPPASEYLKSVMGIGYPNIDSSDVGFDNSIYNPEIQKLFRSFFVNPNRDPAPSLVTPSVVGEITGISPNEITIGQELQISGSGFGTKMGRVEFLNPSSSLPAVSKYEVKSWTDSEIKILVLEGPSFRTVYQVSVLTGSGEKIVSNQAVIVSAKPSVSPSPSLGKITQVSPNTIAVGDEIRIVGTGFGDKTGGIQFTEAGTPSNFPFTIKYGITKWTDSEVKIVLLEELKKFPATFSVLTASGEKIISFQSLHPKTSTPSPSPKPQITQVLPNPIPYKNATIQVLGSGFGEKPIGVRFDNFLSPYPAVGFDVKSYTDSEIRIFVYEFPKRAGEWIFSVDNGSFQPATAKLNIDYTETSTPTPSSQATTSSSPTPTQSSSPSPSPLAATQIRISNYKDFRTDNPFKDEGSVTQTFSQAQTIVWKKSTINPNLPIYIAPMNPDGSNAPILEVSLSNGQQLSIPNSSFVIQAKVIKKIVKIAVNSQEFTANFNQTFPIHLPGAESVAGNYQIPVIITYNDGTTKSLLFTFNYKPNNPTTSTSPSLTPSDVAVCNAKGGECKSSCSANQDQVGVCSSGLCCANKVATPSPGASAPTCPGSGVSDGLSNGGWGGPCTPQEADKEVKCGAPGSCSVAACNFNPDRKTYCWYNSGQCYTKEQAGTRCFDVNPTPAPQSSSSVVTCKTDSESAVGCEVECAIDPITGKNAKCHIYNRDSNGECSLSCRGAWNCVPDPICPN